MTDTEVWVSDESLGLGFARRRLGASWGEGTGHWAEKVEGSGRTEVKAVSPAKEAVQFAAGAGALRFRLGQAAEHQITRTTRTRREQSNY